jgi:hypothetical protein
MHRGWLSGNRKKQEHSRTAPSHPLFINTSQLTQPQSHSPPLTPASCHGPCPAKQKHACPPHYAAGRRGHLQQHDTGVPLLITPRQPPGIRVRLASGGLEVGHMVKFLSEEGEGMAQVMYKIYPLVHHSRTKTAAQLVDAGLLYILVCRLLYSIKRVMAK